MACKAVIFDLDGTLLDSLEDLADTVNKILEKMGFPPHENDAYRHFIGDGMRMLVVRALPPAHCTDATVEKCLDAVLETYGQEWARKTHPYPGVPELLDALTARQLPMAIFTNKPHDLARRVVNALLPTWCFSQVMGARHGVPEKPDPTTALEIADRLQIALCNCLYLGDSGADMRAACRAGMLPVGAAWGFRSATEFWTSGARYLLMSPAELLQFT